MSRRICVFTGSRADYGHLRILLRLLQADPDIALQVIVCGQHLMPRFGETWRDIERDGLAIAARIEMDPAGDAPEDIVRAVGRGTMGAADALARLEPEIAVILGDRYEMLAMGQAALLMGIPIAHIHGGEVTEGAVDDSIRHALTKMAHLHFAAAPAYARRVIQMGEDPGRVFDFGAPGLDQLSETEFLDEKELEAELGLPVGQGLLLVTYHPETTLHGSQAAAIAALLAALNEFPDRSVLFTGVNSDAGNRDIDSAIAAYVADRADRTKLVTSLGQRRYLSAMRLARAVIGNSSSGMIEAPALGVPTVNIGARQAGRLRSASIVDCPAETTAISSAIRQVLDPDFRSRARRSEPAYGRGGSSARIAQVLKTVAADRLGPKRFHDVP